MTHDLPRGLGQERIIRRLNINNLKACISELCLIVYVYEHECVVYVSVYVGV